MHLQKYKMYSVTQVCNHFERALSPAHYSNRNIDVSRTELNRNYAPHREAGQVGYIKELLSSTSHMNRKDLVVMCSLIITVPQSLSKDLYDDFFALSYDFFVQRYGGFSGLENPEDIVISAYRHEDETTPHMHFAFVPIKETLRRDKTTGIEQLTPRINANGIFTRKELKTLHPDLQNYLAAHGIEAEILNGNTRRDKYGKPLTIKELKRDNRFNDYNRDYTYTRERF